METKEFNYILSFNIGDRVIYKNKIGKDEGFVTGIYIRQVGILYQVMWSDKEDKEHYDFELELIDG